MTDAIKHIHPFWHDYRDIYLQGLTEREAGKINDFDYTFFEIISEGMTEEQQAVTEK